MENKILMWENLQRRGYNGPCWCVLCNRNWESTFHLFVDCSFVRTVWTTLHTHRNLSGLWVGSSLTECFNKWFSGWTRQYILPIFVCWFIWMEHNFATFEDRKPSTIRVVTLVAIALESYASQEKALVMRNKVIKKEVKCVIGWFDGAAEATRLNNGARGIIKTRDNHIYKWILNCGLSSNTRDELMGA
jgi:hypothetical protein